MKVILPIILHILYTSTAVSQDSRDEKNSWIDTELTIAYNNLDEINKRPGILEQVQKTFQRLNITTLEHIPKTTLKTVELFQNLPFSVISYVLVKDAFSIEQPHYIYPPVVGQGYDVLKDETVPNSPFVINKYEPTLIGYSLPDILICTNNLNDVNVENFKLIESYEEYKEYRLKDLGIEEQINSSIFTGAVRSGYNNIRPDSDAFVSLTAIKEIRNFKCSLNMSSSMNEEFLVDVSNLTPFNQSDRESPREWKAFFNKYGTHVVSEAYGGGYMEGKASGESIKNNLGNSSTLDAIKRNLLGFESLSPGVNRIEIFHSFFGGSPDAKLAEVHRLSPQTRNNLLQQWKDSVRLDPRISELSLKLTPISTIVKLVNGSMGHEVEKSLEHLFKGTLIYVRRSQKPTSRPSERVSTATATENLSTYGPQRTTITLNATQTECDPTKCSEHPPSCLVCECPLSSQDVQKKSVETNSHQEDFTENILGQGYHLMKDTVLRETPFLPLSVRKRGEGITLPYGASVTRLETPCIYRRFDRIPTYSEYASKRIDSIYTPIIFLNPTGGFTKFLGAVRPGYNVMERLAKHGPFSVYQESRFFKVQLDTALLSFTPEFETAVMELPSHLDNNDCKNQEKWLDFFEEYGTHVVTEAYAGRWEYLVYNGLSENKVHSLTWQGIPNDHHSDCIALGYNEKQGKGKNAEVSPETVSLTTLSKVVRDKNFRSNNLASDYDIIMTDLLENKLRRC